MTDIVLLDGAIGQELTHRGKGEDNPLWSTAVMASDPDMVGALHSEYFAAGATVATTNTYALLPDRVGKFGMAERLDDLVRVAFDQAEAARDRHGSGRIAAALGPLGQSYRADLVWSVHEAVREYTPVLSQASRADLILCETVASVAQAETVLSAIRELSNLPVWIAFTVNDADGTKLRSGESLSDAMAAARSAEAVLLNCSRPEAIADGVPHLAAAGRPYGAYANGFTAISDAFLGARPTVNALTERDDMGPEAYARAALGWAAEGATILGGCCEVGPHHIKALHHALLSHGYEVI